MSCPPICRTAASWVLYILGDLTSRLARHVPLGCLYSLYQWLMLRSSDLDRERKIWKDVKNKEDSP